MNSKLALTLSCLNPALNNPAQKAGCSNHVRVSLIFVITNIYFQLSFTFPFNLVLFCFLFVVVVGGVVVVVVFFGNTIVQINSSSSKRTPFFYL